MAHRWAPYAIQIVYCYVVKLCEKVAKLRLDYPQFVLVCAMVLCFGCLHGTEAQLAASSLPSHEGSWVDPDKTFNMVC